MKLNLELEITPQFCRSLQSAAQKARHGIEALPATKQRNEAAEHLLSIEAGAMHIAELLEDAATAHHLSKTA